MPFRPVPPLAPYPPDDVLSDLAAAVSAEAVDLGAGKDEDGDREVLRELASVLVDIGLTGLTSGRGR
jgi:hypothetical protein